LSGGGETARVTGFESPVEAGGLRCGEGGMERGP
jgi:hypothetical protein